MSFLREVQLDDNFGPFDAFRRGYGFIPKLLRAQSCLPRALEAQTSLESAVRLEQGAISGVQKERIPGLPAKYRVVVMLRDIEQLSTDEVARQLGLSVPAVKVRLLRGRLMLREWLSPHFATGARRVAE